MKSELPPDHCTMCGGSPAKHRGGCVNDYALFSQHGKEG